MFLSSRLRLSDATEVVRESNHATLRLLPIIVLVRRVIAVLWERARERKPAP